MNRTDSDLIDLCGGTSAVAKLCRCRPASVSEWRRKGIPQARRMFLELARPDVFAVPGGAAADPAGEPRHFDAMEHDVEIASELGDAA